MVILTSFKIFRVHVCFFFNRFSKFFLVTSLAFILFWSAVQSSVSAHPYRTGSKTALRWRAHCGQALASFLCFVFFISCYISSCDLDGSVYSRFEVDTVWENCVYQTDLLPKRQPSTLSATLRCWAKLTPGKWVMYFFFFSKSVEALYAVCVS